MQVLTTKIVEQRPYLVTAQDKRAKKQKQKQKNFTKMTSRILAYLYRSKQQWQVLEGKEINMLVFT